MFWTPETFAPWILDLLAKLLANPDLTHFGFIKVLTELAFPLLSREIYKKGIYELPRILEMTFVHLTSQDLKKANLLLE